MNQSNQSNESNQIIELLDSINTSQTFLKSNYQALNNHWINPRIGIQSDPTYIPNIEINQQIENSINQIDLDLSQIIRIIVSNKVLKQICECSTWSEFQGLILINLSRIEFIFGIPPQIHQDIFKFLELDFSEIFIIAKQFIFEFKRTFNYKFLEFITDELLANILHTSLHIKKIYLAHHYTNEKEN